MHWLARGLGVSTLSVESDPSAQAFYERLGARHVRNVSRPVCGELGNCRYLNGGLVSNTLWREDSGFIGCWRAASSTWRSPL
jgi:hypothetical protein